MEPFRIRRVTHGFTLVELIVVLAIILIMTTVVINSQSSFNKTLILANTTYDIALTLRTAQTYGLNSRALATLTNVGYGLHFESGTPGSFKLFADTNPVGSSGTLHCPPIASGTPNCKPGDAVYTSSSDTLVQLYTFGNGMTVKDFCAYAGTWSCTSAHDGATGELTSLDISFTRPNPEPFISTNQSYAAPPSSVTKACLTVTSPQGGERFISVAASGQINSKAASCPLL